MGEQEQTGNAPPAGRTVGIGADQGDNVPAPQPSGLSAEAAGTVGPGALAAAEAPGRSATELAGLAPDDVELLRGLARRAGGVEALLRWLEAHRDLA